MSCITNVCITVASSIKLRTTPAFLGFWVNILHIFLTSLICQYSPPATEGTAAYSSHQTSEHVDDWDTLGAHDQTQKTQDIPVPDFMTLGQKYSVAIGSTIVLPCRINETGK